MTRFEIDANERRAEARALHTALEAIREDMARRANLRLGQWAPYIQRPEFHESARNLADYLALRRGDLTPFQPRLTALGLSSLGRAEAHVRPSLDAVLSILRLLGAEYPSVGDDFPPSEIFAAGPARLKARRDALFGRSETVAQSGGGTRIMVTLPSVAAQADLIPDLKAAGADCLRINCAHDSPEIWAAFCEKAAQTSGGMKLQFDLAGPKVRILDVQSDAPRLHLGAQFRIVADLTKGKARRKLRMPEVTLSHPELLARLAVGIELSIDEGKLRAEVVSVDEDGAVCEVQTLRAKGMRLKPEKSVNLPGVDMDLPAITEEDLAILPFIMAHADVIALSFAQRVEDVVALIDAMEAARGSRDMPALMLKIETPMGLRALPELIVAAGGRVPVGVMIARGDLAAEIGFERLSEIQEELLWLCEAAEVPVVWATQVLEGMVKEGQPGRGEMTDAAMSQRAECVMLNKGPHIVAAVRMLRGILTRMDRYQTKKSPRLGALGLWHEG